MLQSLKWKVPVFPIVLFLKGWREKVYRKNIQLAFPLCFSYTVQINYEYVYYLFGAFSRCKQTHSLSHLTTSELFKAALPEASWQNRIFFLVQLLGLSSCMVFHGISCLQTCFPPHFVFSSFLFQATTFPILRECTTFCTVESWSCLGFLTIAVMQIVTAIPQSSLSFHVSPQASPIKFSEKSSAVSSL